MNPLTRVLGAMVDLLLPPQCLLCEAELSEPSVGERTFCTTCQQALRPDESPRCVRCAARVPHLAAMPDCRWCREHGLRFDRAWVLGGYDAGWRNAVLAMKRPAGDPLALALARHWWATHGSALAEERPSVVLGVPLHWTRRWTRGTNSAAVMAEVLARQVAVRYFARGVRRVRRTQGQGELPPTKRVENVRGAFQVSRRFAWQGKCVLLVDDVLTTGATASEIAGRLKRAGASRVVVAAIARAEGGL